jgi:hypothetical protein
VNLITPQIEQANSDFISGSCKSTTATSEKHIHSNKQTLLNITSMTLAFIQINNLNFSQDTIGNNQDITNSPLQWLKK